MVLKPSTSYNNMDILSDMTGMYHYTGSLTTPGCAEIVQWIVMETPMHVEKSLVTIPHPHIEVVVATVTLGYIDAARRFVFESEMRWHVQKFCSTEFCFLTMY